MFQFNVRIKEGLPSTKTHLIRIALMLALFGSFAREGFAPDFTLPSFSVFKKDAEGAEETAKAPYGPGGLCELPNGDYVISTHQFFDPPFRVLRRKKGRKLGTISQCGDEYPNSGSADAGLCARHCL